MAKSIRSKWKRKCRAVKRERYGKKELERLQKTIANDPFNKPADIEMSDNLAQIATIVNKTPVKQASKNQKEDDHDEENEMVKMETDGKQRIFNVRTMKDQHGTYPVWMHPRKVHKNKKAGKGKIKKKKSKS